MNIKTYYFTFALVFALCLGVSARPRIKRQMNSFMIIGNKSAPCEEFNSELPHVALTQEEKMEVFRYLGGGIIPSLMAIDRDAARKTFTNLIPLPATFKEKYQTFAQEIKNSNMWLKKSINEFVEQNRSDRKDEVDKSVSKKDESNRSDHFIERLSSKVLKRQHRSKREEESEHKGNDVELDVALPEDIGVPAVIQSDAGTSYLENCIVRGSPTRDIYFLYMCSACSATRDLGDDWYPQMINEVSCNTGDGNCLFVEGLPHGKCMESQMPLNILNRRTGQCVLALKNGDTVVADEWVIETQLVSVGCECTVNRDSFFVQFL